MNRTPPAHVRRKLRQEIGFGCPVLDCGNPYLSWHHFDPPWKEKPHHNPEGMIALCLEHHKKADAGAFTKEQLRHFKKIGCQTSVKGKFDWMRKQLAFIIGGNLFVRTDFALLVDSVPCIWFNRDEAGYALLNVKMYTPPGKKRLLLTDNFWIERGNPTDLISPPSGRKLKVTYQDEDKLDLEFREITSSERLVHSFPNLFSVSHESQSNLQFPLVVVAISVRIAVLKLDIKPAHMDINTNGFIGCIFEGTSIDIDTTTGQTKILPYTRNYDDEHYSS